MNHKLVEDGPILGIQNISNGLMGSLQGSQGFQYRRSRVPMYLGTPTRTKGSQPADTTSITTAGGSLTMFQQIIAQKT